MKRLFCTTLGMLACVVLVGCTSNPNPTPEEQAQRSASLLSEVQPLLPPILSACENYISSGKYTDLTKNGFKQDRKGHYVKTFGAELPTGAIFPPTAQRGIGISYNGPESGYLRRVRERECSITASNVRGERYALILAALNHYKSQGYKTELIQKGRLSVTKGFNKLYFSNTFHEDLNFLVMVMTSRR